MTKSFTLFALGTILIAGSAMAGTNTQKIQMNGKKADIEKLMKSHQSSALRGPKKEMAVTDVITEAEGTKVIYTKTAVGYDYGYEYDDTGMASEIVFGENNEVYIKSIITGSGFQTYVKGEIDGDKITLPLPQTLYYNDSYGYGMNICMMILDSTSTDLNYEVVDIDSIELLYDAETGVITMELDDPYEYLLGIAYTDDESWVGYGDVFQEYEPYDIPLNEIPAGVEVEDYVFMDASVAYKVGVAIDGDKLYIKGLSESLPDGVVVADIDGNVASISNDQLVGTYNYYFIYTKAAYVDGSNLELADVTYDLQLDLDNNTIIGANEDLVLLLNAALDRVYFLDKTYNDFKIYIQESYAGTPENPYGLEIFDNWDYYGSYDFSFFITNISTEGSMLDTDYIYYRIYVNGEIFEINEDYDGVEEPTENIPYNFQNGWDIYSYYAENNRIIAIYLDDITTLGVQTVYIYEGVETVSGIVTIDFATGEITEEPGVSGVDTIEVNNGVETIYNLQGVKVSRENMTKGLYIINGKKVLVK